MFVWENVKNPTEVKRYAFEWEDELGEDAIQSASAELMASYGAGLTIVDGTQFDADKGLSYVKVSGGTAGQTARIQGTIVTTGGETITEVGFLTIAEASDPLTSDLQDLQADLRALEKARITLLTGTQVKEVWREGRRIVYNVASVADLDRVIQEYRNLIAAKASEATGKPRFRALRPRFN